jgi:thiamine-monophosphate kinase
VIDAGSIPLSAAARDLVAQGKADLSTLVSGGDDYEILCTVPEDRIDGFAQAAREAGVAVTSIGTIIAGNTATRWLDAEGREISLPRLSYSHF